MSKALGKSEGDEGDHDLSDRAEATEQNYPGLNKRHGFFRAIERNQVDRDVYHRNQSEWRDQRRKQTDKEVMDERQQVLKAEQDAKEDRRRRRRERQRPDRAMYQPPRTRMISQPPAEASPLYKIEIEVKPGVVWKTQVSKVRCYVGNRVRYYYKSLMTKQVP